MNILIIAVLVGIWGFIGFVNESERNFITEIPNPKKRMIYIALCGPFVWIALLFLLLGEWFRKE